jgi:hypothetical protein
MFTSFALEQNTTVRFTKYPECIISIKNSSKTLIVLGYIFKEPSSKPERKRFLPHLTHFQVTDAILHFLISSSSVFTNSVLIFNLNEGESFFFYKR